jgi:mannose-1-phosphate guanylyltransferase
MSAPDARSLGATERWAVVLAGGDGVRLRTVVREIVGDDRPKQYVPLVGPRPLLRQTLDRVGLLFPPARTVVVTQRAHAPHLAAVGLHPAVTVLAQPANRGTALGLLLPVHWIAQRAPGALVGIFPSDHFVMEEHAFMAHVAEVAGFAEREPAWTVLVGARPTGCDADYGWVEPREVLAATGSGRIYRAGRFREKPRAAARLRRQGWLWNTFVLIARVEALVAAGALRLPELHARLSALMAPTPEGPASAALEELYARAPSVNFSVAVLQAGLPALAVSELPPLTWSDLGTPRRLLALLHTLRLSPPWLGRVRSAELRRRGAA